MTLDSVIARLQSVLTEWDEDDCLDFAYYAEEELTNIIAEYENATS